MEAVEAGGYEEGGAVDTVSDGEWGFVIFQALEKCKIEAKENCQAERLNCFLSVAFYNAVVSSGNCNS